MQKAPHKSADFRPIFPLKANKVQTSFQVAVGNYWKNMGVPFGYD